MRTYANWPVTNKQIDPARDRPRLKSQWEILRERPAVAQAPRPSFLAKFWRAA